MKSLFSLVVILAASICYASSANVASGKPKDIQMLTLHVDGRPTPVLRIDITEHPMGCMLQTGNCFVNNTVSFWMQVGPQAQNCSKWYSKILRDETRNPAATPYPYLQLVIVEEPTLTDEGILVFQNGAVTCSGSLDWMDLQ